MEEKVAYEQLEDALRRCGSSWDAAQAHGLLTGRLATGGVASGPEWLLQVLEGVDENNAARAACQQLLDALYQGTFWQLTERLSEFAPLLPDDETDAQLRTVAMAHWSEGFLHGLVSTPHGDALKERLRNLDDQISFLKQNVDGIKSLSRIRVREPSRLVGGVKASDIPENAHMGVVLALFERPYSRLKCEMKWLSNLVEQIENDEAGFMFRESKRQGK